MMIYLQLFFEFFKAGFSPSAGGMATLPFLYDISDKTGWFTYGQLADMVAISESTPGPIGVNMATYVGFTTAGISGSVIATLGLITPSIIIILIIAGFLKAFKDNKYVQHAFYGLRPASTGLIAAAGFSVFALIMFHKDAYAASGNIPGSGEHSQPGPSGSALLFYRCLQKDQGASSGGFHRCIRCHWYYLPVWRRVIRLLEPFCRRQVFIKAAAWPGRYPLRPEPAALFVLSCRKAWPSPGTSSGSLFSFFYFVFWMEFCSSVKFRRSPMTAASAMAIILEPSSWRYRFSPITSTKFPT